MTGRYPFTLIKEKLAARRGEALDFAIGRRRIRLPESIDKWIRANVGLAMKPADNVDIKGFTEAASDLLRREYSVYIGPERILPTPGARAAMSAIIACVLEPGDGVLITEPGYPAFARLAIHRHANIHKVILDPEHGFAPDLGSAFAGGAAPARMIALNYPNNPTGATLSTESISLLRGVAGTGTTVFNDATYGPLVYDHHPTSLLHNDNFQDSQTELVELHSFSKLFPIGPVAVSFLAGSETTMRSISTYSEFAWSAPSVLQLQATTLCLRDSARLRELRKFFPAQLERLRQTLINVGFEPYPAAAGVYSICRIPARIGGKVVHTATEAAGRLLHDFDLAVVPWDTPRHSYLRFSSLYEPEDLERLAGLRKRLQLG
ncbi:MAG: pyridoxal phosphate-dependent aminotransferase [Woeseia sp.]